MCHENGRYEFVPMEMQMARYIAFLRDFNLTLALHTFNYNLVNAVTRLSTRLYGI